MQENFIPQNEELKEQKPSHIDYYMATPNKNGGFNLRAKHEKFKDGMSIHALEHIQGTNRYKVYVNDASNSFALAMQYPDIRIQPLFDEISAYDYKATSIQVVKPAIVELQGDKFVLISKGEIDYDNKGINERNKKQSVQKPVEGKNVDQGIEDFRDFLQARKLNFEEALKILKSSIK